MAQGLKSGSCSVSMVLLLAFSLLAISPRPSGSQPPPVAKNIGAEHPAERETYIIHVRNPGGMADFTSPEKRLEFHQSFLPPSASPEPEIPRIIYSYESVISGFAAKLTREELKAVEKMDGFLHAHQEQLLTVQTTHTPEFLGLLRRGPGLWEQADFGKGLIIGVLDSGIHPDHPSFRDDGLLPPPPKKWNGRCDFPRRLCNNKLIGAVSFVRDEEVQSPDDGNGHGTHVAGTAVGMFAEGAQVHGMAAGTAAGTAPYAHLAVYKVCNRNGICTEGDALKGIDQAISDGVDVISMSFGYNKWHFYENALAIGSLAAVSRGIFVSSAGGNTGPGDFTVMNDAPWILTVGASTTDRTIRATLSLENGMEIQGETINQPTGFDPKLHVLAYPGASGISAMEFCAHGSLQGVDVRDKFVMCRDGGGSSSSDKAAEVKGAGGAAVIIMNTQADGFTIQAENIDFPAITVSYADSRLIRQYFATQLKPRASLQFRGTDFRERNTPAVASFSSRGPSWANYGRVLKPDVVGPGVNILAAWIGPDQYHIMSGTSMAAPHLSGVAALLKRVHEDWSAAAIKSAIMTTSDVANRARRHITDETGNPADVFAMGAGHVNPPRAVEPGLVYDIGYSDYTSYICSLGYTKAQVEAVARGPVDCSRPVTADELNYPSLSTVMGSRQEKVLTRIVTNVGEEKSIYKAEVVEPEGVTVRVVPEKLVFKASVKKLSFKVTLTTGEPTSLFASGMLTWVSSNHRVASPITILLGGRPRGGELQPGLPFPAITTVGTCETQMDELKAGKSEYCKADPSHENRFSSRLSLRAAAGYMWRQLRRWFV